VYSKLEEQQEKEKEKEKEENNILRQLQEVPFSVTGRLTH
jgi:hypothetical protein